MRSRKVALYGLLTALAMILSYVETLVPLSVAVPGIKIGLANIAVVFALYRLGWKDAAAVSAVRVLLVSLTFGNAFSMIYSLAGAALSLAAMTAAKACGRFGSVGVSVLGGVLHNVGQILVAVFVLETARLAYYLPILCVSGVTAGVFVGIVAGLLVKRVKI